MKKIITYIISLTIFFSSLSITFASEGYIERLLEINYGVEQTKLNLSELDYIKFSSTKYNNMYNEFKTADSILRKEFMNNYREGTYTYYQTNGIVTNYNNFIYYTNKFFYYLRLKERGYTFTELDTALINSYTNMRRSYRHVKNIIK